MSAIVKAGGTDVVQASSLTADLPNVFQLARALLQARGFIPAHLKTEGEIAAVILAGLELGLQPMTALRSVYLVNGKVGVDASMQLALMLRAGITHEWVADGSDCKVAHLRLERGGRKHEQRYTIDDAKRAGLAGSGTWQKHTPAMLRARCVSSAARAFAPDVLSGVYVPDELDEIQGKYQPQRQQTRNAAQPAPVQATPELRVVEAEPEPEAPQAEEQPTPEEINSAALVQALVSEVATIPAEMLREWYAHARDELGQAGADEQQRMAVSAAFGDRCKALGLKPRDVVQGNGR